MADTVDCLKTALADSYTIEWEIGAIELELFCIKPAVKLLCKAGGTELGQR